MVELVSGQPCIVEALVCWRNPGRGLLPPAELIDVAEESGLIVSLGEWVLDDACPLRQRGFRSLLGCHKISE